MLKKHSQIFEGLFTASDIAVASAAWVLSYWVRFYSGFFPLDKGIPAFGDYLKIVVFIWPIWAYVYRRFGLYRPMRGASRFRETWKVFRANSFAVLILLALTYLFREKSVPFSRLVFVVFWVLSGSFAVLSRTAIRLALREMRRRGYNLRYAVIVGSGPLAMKVARRMVQHPEYGVELLGCLTSDSNASLLAGSGANHANVYNLKTADAQRAPRFGFERASSPVGGRAGAALMAQQFLDAPLESEAASPIRIIGTYADLPELLRNGALDQVIVALPLSDHVLMESVINSIGDEMVDVRIVPDLYQFIQLGSQVEEFDGLPVVSLASTPLSGINRLVKRVVDLLLGSFFFVSTLPVMAVTALLIKTTSRGPVFYSQERVGLDGRTFKIYKFRTMELSAELEGAKFAVANDPRVTALGRILRQFNIDELPQLVNVILGQMSLVGPRPERPVFIQEFRRRVPRYMLRHKVQAGMTGWAQVHGWRGNTSIERRIEHDLYYIEHWSLGLDLRILGLTVLHSFTDRNAY